MRSKISIRNLSCLATQESESLKKLARAISCFEKPMIWLNGYDLECGLFWNLLPLHIYHPVYETNVL